MSDENGGTPPPEQDRPKDQAGPPPPRIQPKPITDRDLMGINFTMNIEPYPGAPPTPPAREPAAPPPPPPETDPDDPRPSKKLGLAEAIARFVPDGVASLALGGLHMHNNPMALVRELVRQRKRIKRLITSPAGCINADLLIGAGLVEEVITPYIGFEFLGLAPAFRRLSQEGRLKVTEIDELSLVLGLQAGAANLPFVTLPPGLEFSDVVRRTPEYYRFTTDPFTGREVLAAPGLQPQVALVYASQADKFGNATHKGAAFSDREMIMASRTVVLQVEQVISTGSLTRTPQQVTVPSHRVNAVVEASFGCHPTSSHRFYHYDEGHLKEYLRLARTEEGFKEYLEKYILHQGEFEYLGKTEIAQW